MIPRVRSLYIILFVLAYAALYIPVALAIVKSPVAVRAAEHRAEIIRFVDTSGG